MKTSFLLVIFLAVQMKAQTARAGQILCASPSGESLSVQSDTTKLSVSYDSGRGPQYAPIEDGPVRQISDAYYQMEYKDLKSILGGFAAQWTGSQCSVNSSWWLSACHGGATLTSDPQGKTGAVATGVSFSQLVETGASGNQTTYRLRITFEKSGNTYFVPLSFPQESCQVTGF